MIKSIFNKFFKSNNLNKKFSFPFIYNNCENIGSPLNAYGCWQSFRYYYSASPFFHAINLLATQAATIRPLVLNKKTGEFISDHPLLEKLNHPNTDVTFREFMIQFVTNYEVTGNNFCIATNMPGKLDSPPLEIYIDSPCYITINPDKSSAFPHTYQISNNYASQYNGTIFYRDIKEFRFFNDKNKNMATAEIYQSKTFSPPTGSALGLYGMPKAAPLFYDIEQFLQASNHNLALLSKGARPSGVLNIDDYIDDDDQQRLQKQFNDLFKGSSNAGEVLISNTKMEFVELSKNNKDMDFMELKKNVMMAIYNTFNIPLPLISPDTMTLSNFETSKLNLYDQAVLPLVRTVYQELTDFLMHRYETSKDYILSFDPREVPALSPRHTEEINNLNTLNVLTANELRRLIKFDPLHGGADSLYQTAGMVPYANSASLKSENTKSLIDYKKNEFIEIMKNKKNDFGNRIFSDEKIEEIWERNAIEYKK